MSAQQAQVLADERAVVLACALAYPKDGSRRLAWQMIDADVAYLSPSTVYRVLQDAELLARWKCSTRTWGPHRRSPRGRTSGGTRT